MARLKSREQILAHSWWVCGLLALIFAGIAYGFASLAINTGELYQYGLSIGFLIWAAVETKHAVGYALKR